MPTERDLWDDFRRGDKAAYAELYRQFAPRLHGYGNHLVRDREAVADCIHDLFVYLHQHRRGLGPTDSIAFYLFRALRRRLAGYQQTASRFLHRDGWDEAATDFEIVPSLESQWVDDQTRLDQHERLNRLVNTLPRRQKEALFLLYYSQLPHQQIAEIMAVKIETVYTLLSRALTLLRQHWQELSLLVSLFFF